jgi:hypothetical protein
MGVDLNFLRPQKGTNILPTLANKIMQPGVDPSITAAVPQAPKEGIPQMQSASGLMTPGANFTISPNTF